MPAAKKIVKRKTPKAKKPTKKAPKKPTKKTTPKKGGGCGCTGKEGGQAKDMNGGFIDMAALGKLSVPFGLLLAKAGLEDFLKDKKKTSSKSSVKRSPSKKSPSRKMSNSRRTV